MFDITDLIPDWKLSVQFWDILDPEITNLPVAIWIDNNQLFPEKRGFWFYISKFKGMTLCSYIDTEGNFYHDLDDFYLSVIELLQLVAFARKYKDIIDELFECEDFFTHDFISLLRYKNPFDPNEVFNIKHKYPNACRVRIPNTLGKRPRTFEIDCLEGSNAHEIKWKDATTDGDHITKEHTRIKAIKKQGYTPIRVMFFYPQRTQAIRIQETLETLYNGVNGKYYYGDAAWQYIYDYTGVNLLEILQKIAGERTCDIQR